jgi:hypothetical protein
MNVCCSATCTCLHGLGGGEQVAQGRDHARGAACSRPCSLPVAAAAGQGPSKDARGEADGGG